MLVFLPPKSYPSVVVNPPRNTFTSLSAGSYVYSTAGPVGGITFTALPHTSLCVVVSFPRGLVTQETLLRALFSNNDPCHSRICHQPLSLHTINPPSMAKEKMALPGIPRLVV